MQERALALTARLGEVPSPPLLRSVALRALTRGDFPGATGPGRLLLAEGERLGDPVLVVEAAYLLGVSAFWQGDFGAAREHLTTALAHYRPEDGPVFLVRYGQDPKAVCLSRLANTLYFLGRPEEARVARAEALEWATQIGHPYSRAVTLVFSAVLAIDLGDLDDVRTLSAALSALDPGPPQQQLPSAALHGVVLAMDGDGPGGLRLAQQAADAAAAGDAAPGIVALTTRVLLAAALVAGDEVVARAATARLHEVGGMASVWAAGLVAAGGVEPRPVVPPA